jgi:hypothetical protein
MAGIHSINYVAAHACSWFADLLAKNKSFDPTFLSVVVNMMSVVVSMIVLGRTKFL